MVFVTVVTLFTSRIVLAQLGAVDFGIYNAVGGIVLFFSFIVPTLASSVQRFLNYYLGKQDLEMVSKVFSMSVIIHIVFSAVVVILGETLGVWFLNTHMTIPAERLSAANFVLQCSIISLVVILMGIPYNALILANQRMKFFAKISVVTVVIKVVTAVLLIFVPIDKLDVYAVFMLLIMIVARLLATTYCKIQFKNCKFQLCWEPRLFKEIFSFSGWNLYGNIGNMIYTYGINIVLNIFCGPVVNAARAISVQVQHVMDQTSNSFLTAVTPQIIQSYASGNEKYVEILFLRATKYTFYLMAFVCVPLIFCMQNVLDLWLVKYPDHSVNFCRLVVVICWMTAFFQPSYTIMQATGSIKKYQIIQGSSLIVILPLAYLFLKLNCQPEVVFLISIAAILLSKVMGLFIMQKKVPFLSLKKYALSILKNILCIILPVGTSFALYCNVDSSLVRTAEITAVSTFLLALSIYLFDFSKEEVAFVKSLWRRR
ncbi:MAG: oligosaccharide flippase family protein [Fibrobacter sp.]|nr:oligosaccharide flippase family protein [Fibrobacter sp.]